MLLSRTCRQTIKAATSYNSSQTRRTSVAVVMAPDPQKTFKAECSDGIFLTFGHVRHWRSFKNLSQKRQLGQNPVTDPDGSKARPPHLILWFKIKHQWFPLPPIVARCSVATGSSWTRSGPRPWLRHQRSTKPSCWRNWRVDGNRWQARHFRAWVEMEIWDSVYIYIYIYL